ncbi:MAG: PorT family protein [Bacteroidales bacterium]|nr:PorT family protein [Bacteroidales bacterium]
MKRKIDRTVLRVMTLMLVTLLPARVLSQEIVFVVHADPVISWMGSNESEYAGEGARPGFDIGLNVLQYFADNYAISTGISIMSAGCRQSVSEDHKMVFTNFEQVVPAGDEIRYNLKYMNIPAGVRLQTNQVGYFTYFTDMGFDIRMLLKSTVDLPTLQINHENGKNEVYGLNAGWHVGGGIEYELPIDASIIAGLSYAQDFFDVTKDLRDVYQHHDRSTVRMVRFRLGLKF